MQPVNIACVLQTQGQFYNGRHRVEYSAKDVEWLYKQVQKHVTVPYRFVCFSDIDIPCERIQLLHGWIGWWSKMELFRPGRLPGRTFYIDLDTVLVNNIDDLVVSAKPDEFIMLGNLSGHPTYGSGLMAWEGDYSYLYREFAADAKKYMREYVTSLKCGDQGFIAEHLDGIIRFQDRYPNSIISYKFDMLKRGVTLDNASIVCFHGKPKPKEVDLPWVPKY